MNWTSDLGPQRTNKFKKALRLVERETTIFTEILRDGTRLSVSTPFGHARNTSVGPALEAVGNAFGWKVDKKNYSAVMARLESALAFVRENTPVEDRRLA